MDHQNLYVDSTCQVRFDPIHVQSLFIHSGHCRTVSKLNGFVEATLMQDSYPSYPSNILQMSFFWRQGTNHIKSSLHGSHWKHVNSLVPASMCDFPFSLYVVESHETLSHHTQFSLRTFEDAWAMFLLTSRFRGKYHPCWEQLWFPASQLRPSAVEWLVKWQACHPRTRPNEHLQSRLQNGRLPLVHPVPNGCPAVFSISTIYDHDNHAMPIFHGLHRRTFVLSFQICPNRILHLSCVLLRRGGGS